MDFWVLLGAVGSVASLIGLMLPLQTKRQRLIHAAYGLAIALFAAAACGIGKLTNAFTKSNLQRLGSC
jgi:hypothetical protein